MGVSSFVTEEARLRLNSHVARITDLSLQPAKRELQKISQRSVLPKALGSLICKIEENIKKENRVLETSYAVIDLRPIHGFSQKLQKSTNRALG